MAPVILAVSGLVVPLQSTSKTVVQVGSTATVQSNTTVQITCPVTGMPKPAVTWAKDDEQLKSGGRYTIAESGVLTISELLVEDSGQYSCTAQNIQGSVKMTGILEVIGEWFEQPFCGHVCNRVAGKM